MTLRLVIGVDPGKTGAIAMLADGEPVGFLDMPVDVDGRVDPLRLAADLRQLITQHAGAAVVAVLEHVGGFRGQGGASMFAFGDSNGAVRGVLGALGLVPVRVRPQAWKKHFGLQKTEKDAARVLALGRWPRVGVQLMQVKNGGRADALLVATWAHETEAWIPSAPVAKPRRKKPSRARELAPA